MDEKTTEMVLLADYETIGKVRCPWCGESWEQSVPGTVGESMVLACPSCKSDLEITTVHAALIRPLDGGE